jgi:hypothetical protein
MLTLADRKKRCFGDSDPSEYAGIDFFDRNKMKDVTKLLLELFPTRLANFFMK